MDVDVVPPIPDAAQGILDTVEGEIYFFRALMRTRPVGMHRHFHVMSMQHAIEKGTGHFVSIEDIWSKLRTCYNLDILEALLKEAEYESSGSNASTPQSIHSPTPNQNLAVHPFFRAEFTLPADSSYDSMVADRRMRATASLPSSPASLPLKQAKPANRRGKKRSISKVDLAGLVSGDSDSSALTQESGDDVEEDAHTPASERKGSVATGTDGETEDFAEEETGDATDGLRGSQSYKRGTYKRGRGRGASTGTRGMKRKKR